MKNRWIALGLLSSLVALSGCNGIGDKDTILARIDGEKVYQEDLDLLLKSESKLKKEKNRFIYDELYSKAALTARAIDEFPEIKQEWEDYFKGLEPRLLTIVFQRYYAMENMTYSDGELRAYYEANRSLFPEDSLGGFLKVRAEVASCYYASKNSTAFDAYLKEKLTKADATAQDTLSMKKEFADNRRKEIQKELSENILEKERVEIHTIPPLDPKEFYNTHKDLFMTVPGYELYHVQGDSAALAALFAEPTSLEQFKQIALKESKNPLTAKDSGLVGGVKKDYALPYGIGMVKNLASVLDSVSPGRVTPVVRADNGSFHRFYLVRTVPSKLKSYDRVEAAVVDGIKSGIYFDADTSLVLISQSGKPVFTESDLNWFNKTFYKKTMSRNLHDRLVSMIAENIAFATAAKVLKLNHRPEYRAMVRSARRDFICDRYIEKWKGMDKLSDDTLKAWYDRIGSPIHQGYSFEKAKDDLRLVASFPKNMYMHEYYMCYRAIYAGKTYEQSIPAIYAYRANEYDRLLKDRLSADAYTNAAVHLYDTDTPEYRPELSAEALLAKADSLYKADKKSDAYYVYRGIMYAFADVDSIFEKVAYEMAQIQGENEEFLDAEGEYYAFYVMWPQSPNAEKAMFSRGFMLNENLGMNDKALEVLEDFMVKYPKSELFESAQWLVNNIKSGGKLAEELMSKISAEE